MVSLRRIEKYLNGLEVASVAPLDGEEHPIAFQSATVTWPQDRTMSSSALSSAAATPKRKFILMDLTLDFPLGQLSLICGKLGSGKTLLLLCMYFSYELYNILMFIELLSSFRRSRCSDRTDRVPSFSARYSGIFRRCSCSPRRMGCLWCLCIRTSGKVDPHCNKEKI